MKIEWKSCIKIVASAFLLFLCVIYWPTFTGFVGTLMGAAAPLIIGCVVAYVVNILMSFYERHYFPKTEKAGLIKSRRPICMLAAFVTLATIIVLLGKLVVPELVACVELLAAKIPGTVNGLSAWLRENGLISEDMLDSLRGINWQEKIRQIISALTTGLGNVMGTAANLVFTVFSGIVTALFAFIFSIYLLTGKEKLSSQFDRVMKRYMKQRHYSRTKYVLSVLNDCFHKYIVGQCTEAVILGALCMVGMLILGFPYATMTGAVIAVTALIPVAGGYIGAAVGAFMIMTVSPVKALLFLLYIVVLQQIEGNLIYPKVVGESIGLPGIWVLTAVTIGGGVLGIPGMLIGVPLAAAIYKLVGEDIDERLASVPAPEEAPAIEEPEPVKAPEVPQPAQPKKKKKNKKK